MHRVRTRPTGLETADEGARQRRVAESEGEQGYGFRLRSHLREFRLLQVAGEE